MTTTSHSLTLPEFEARFASEKPYFEFWDGEAIQKSSAEWSQSLLQIALCEVLQQAGYKAAPEITLKIDPRFQFVPDVVAAKRTLQFPYPTKPLDIVIEILSPDDAMSRLLAKCRTYQAWGFREIYLVDPATRLLFRWQEHRLEEVSQLAGVNTEVLWTAWDKKLS